MHEQIDQLLDLYERRGITRRALIAGLTAVVQLGEQATDPGRMRPRLQRHSTARHGAEDVLQRFRTGPDSLLQLDLPRFIHHAVPAVAISQIQSDG